METGQLVCGIDVFALTLDQAKELQLALHKKFPLKCDFTLLDWTKTDAALAAEQDVTCSTIRTHRRRLGHPKVQNTKWHPACLAWDWSKSDTAISREQLANLNTVKVWRIKLGKPAPPRDYYRIPNISPATTTNWGLADWQNKLDVEIARELGCSRERVRQKRANLGLPKRMEWEARWERYSEAFPNVNELSVAEFKQKFPGTARKTFLKWCGAKGIKVKPYQKPSVLPWDQLNFALPNKFLDSIWRMIKNSVANHRYNHCLQKPAFRSVHGSVPPEWAEAVEAEKQKAEAWLAEQSGAY